MRCNLARHGVAEERVRGWAVKQIPYQILVLALAVWMASIQAEERKLPPEVAKALNSSTNTTLYALDEEIIPQGTNTDALFYGHKILGQTKLNSEQGKIAVMAIEQAIAGGNGGARCFIPRHALRVMAQGLTYDFLLCYECGWLSVVHQQKEMVRMGIYGSPDELNKLLKAAKIPIPKKQ